MNPKKSALDFVAGFSFVVCWVLPSSMKPSDVVGMFICFFGNLTTPRFWSSRTSIIRFCFLLNIMRLRGVKFI